MSELTKAIHVDQVGYLPRDKKIAVLNFETDGFRIEDETGAVVLSGKTVHFGTDEISGEDTYVADFTSLRTPGTYKILAEGVVSTSFRVDEQVYDSLMKDICKCFYFLRCGDALSEEFAGVYYHKPCHMTKASVFGDASAAPVDVEGGWHDAGDYGRYSTAGAVACAHLLYGIRFFPKLLDVHYEIPKVPCARGNYPDILAEIKVELDFLLKMQREDGSVWHKVTTMRHAEFIMPEEDQDPLYLFPVSSMATADIAAVFALAYSVYINFDEEYAEKLLAASKRAYQWLTENPQEKLFYNPEGSNTGQYDEDEDISNRFWAACSLYEVTGEKSYYEDALIQRDRLIEYDASATKKGYQGDVFTCQGWAEVAGLGSMSVLLKDERNELYTLVETGFLDEADRLVKNATANGYGLCMAKEDFIWGSNMELLKYLMILSVAQTLSPTEGYVDAIHAGIDYILGCNSMDTSYVTGNGEKAYKNPHLRPTAVDDIEDPWPGLVSGGPNVGMQDARAQQMPKNLPPMKCYLDSVECYSLNEITIYWNSPMVFTLAGLL